MEYFWGSLQLAASHNTLLAYALLYWAAIFLGSIAIFPALLLAFEGFFGHAGVLVAASIIIIADVSADMLWYSLGRSVAGTRLGSAIKRRMPVTEKVEHHITRHIRRWLFLAKFLYGFSLPMIFCAGWSRVRFSRFFAASVISIVAWLPIAIAICYLLSSAVGFLAGAATFRKLELLLTIGLGIIFLLQYIASKTLAPVLKEEEV